MTGLKGEEDISDSLLTDIPSYVSFSNFKFRNYGYMGASRKKALAFNKLEGTNNSIRAFLLLRGPFMLMLHHSIIKTNPSSPSVMEKQVCKLKFDIL